MFVETEHSGRPGVYCSGCTGSWKEFVNFTCRHCAPHAWASGDPRGARSSPDPAGRPYEGVAQLSNTGEGRHARGQGLLLFLCALFSFPAISSVDRLIHGGNPLWGWYPPMWFVGVYDVILGTRDPALWALAGRAIAGVRKFMICVAILPVFAFLSVFYALLWDWRTILVHFCFGLTLSAVFMELLLTGFSKIPFTFSYRSASGTVLGFFLAMGLGGRLLSAMMELEHSLFITPWKFVYFYGVAFALLIALRRRNSRALKNSPILEFEQDSGDDLTLLKLELPATQAGLTTRASRMNA